MAQGLSVHGHKERTVGRLAFYIHERQLGCGRLQRVLLRMCPSPARLIVLLPLFVFMLNEFKVIVHQIYFFG